MQPTRGILAACTVAHVCSCILLALLVSFQGACAYRTLQPTCTHISFKEECLKATGCTWCTVSFSGPGSACFEAKHVAKLLAGTIARCEHQVTPGDNPSVQQDPGHQWAGDASALEETAHELSQQELQNHINDVMMEQEALYEEVEYQDRLEARDSEDYLFSDDFWAPRRSYVADNDGSDKGVQHQVDAAGGIVPKNDLLSSAGSQSGEGSNVGGKQVDVLVPHTSGQRDHGLLTRDSHDVAEKRNDVLVSHTSGQRDHGLLTKDSHDMAEKQNDVLVSHTSGQRDHGLWTRDSHDVAERQDAVLVQKEENGLMSEEVQADLEEDVRQAYADIEDGKDAEGKDDVEQVLEEKIRQVENLIRQEQLEQAELI